MLNFINTVIDLFNDNILSSLSFIISLLTFVYMHHTNGFHLKVKLKPSTLVGFNDNNEEQYSYSIKCEIENRSKMPLSIIKVKLNDYSVFKFETEICGNGISMFGKLFDDVYSSFGYPLKLEPYDAKTGILLFCNQNEIKLKKYNLLTIYTTRGKYYKIIKNKIQK